MKIGFDGKRAVRNFTGLGNYSRLIIESLAERIPGNELSVYSPYPLSPSDFDNPRHAWARKPGVKIVLPSRGGLLGKGALWRTFGISRQLRADGVELFHGLSNELPLNIARAGIPSVVTIHDVIYRTMPQCYKPADRRIYDFKYGNSARNATAVIAISECTKRDIMRFYGVREDKIHLIYQDCDPSFRKAVEEKPSRSVLAPYSLPEEYIVQVGTIELRKNAMLSVQALAALRDKFSGLRLLLVGRPTPYLGEVMKEAEKLRVADRVEVRSDIPFRDLPAVVHHARAALYPSRYEGFGLPVLEALNAGTPTVAATGSCLEEAGGHAALYVAPDDTRAMAEALEAILTDPVKAADMRSRGLCHADRFTQSDMASQIHAVYESLLHR